MKGLCTAILGAAVLLGASGALAQRGPTVAPAAVSEPRAALVIGNSAYKVDPLKNPANDAEDMAQTLRVLGFRVTLRKNADRRQIVSAINEFGQELKKGGVGLFYYAGHGVQSKGRNWLVPIGAHIESEGELEFETVDAYRVLALMEEAGNRVNIVILDACRNNPFARAFRSPARGLAQMEAAKGSFIAFATAPGSVAADGLRRNGLYTEQLLASLKHPDSDIDKVFRRVTAEVSRATGNKQVPWISSSLTGDFYFRVDVQVTVTAPSSILGPEPASIELAFWESIKSSTNPADFEVYLRQYPDGHFAGLARNRLQSTQVATAKPSVQIKGTPPAHIGVVVQPVTMELAESLGLSRPMGVVVADVLKGSGSDKAGIKPGDVIIAVDTETVTDGASLVAKIRERVPTGTVTLRIVRDKQEMEVRVDIGTLAPPSLESTQVATAAPSTAVIRPKPAPGSIASMTPGTTLRECDVCPEMVVVPAGSFIMGSPTSEQDRDSNEGPQHQVTISRKFAVGKYEVTFDEWDACVREGGCGHQPSDQGWGRGKRPVINVSWNDAKQYVQWLLRKTGKNYRLLTEAEWEYAARAGTTTPFSTGATINATQANYNATQSYAGSVTGHYRQQTVPVGSFEPNAFGLHDIHGNVWEWTEDCWNANYQLAPGDGSAWASSDCGWRVLRGGSWFSNPRNLRSASRSRDHLRFLRGDGFGFRVARTD